MSEELEIREVVDWTTEDMDSLSSLLMAVVAEGASIGFLPPLSYEMSVDYWNNVLAPNVKLWVGQSNGEIVGTVQLHLAIRQNGTHRAEIAKLMVHPKWRRRGIAQRLLQVAEDAAVREHRSLLVLDTRSGDPSNILYRSHGYIEAGRIPQFAQSANGGLDETVLYYKLL